MGGGDSHADNIVDRDLALIGEAAREAGKIALAYFNADNRVWTKGADSPVSEADLAVDRYLRRQLRSARPEYGWLSEESADTQERLARREVFVVDPIDGTRGFISGNPHWCISVAIVSDHVPSAAVLHCPALQRTFCAARNGGATLNGNPLPGARRDTVRIVTGSNRVNERLNRISDGRFEVFPFLPSLAYRIALVASGEIDGAFAHSGSHEWDVAAADLILSETGGRLTKLDDASLAYNKESAGMPALVAGGRGLQEQLLDIAKSGALLH